MRLALAPVKAMLAEAAQNGDLRGNPVAGYRSRYTMTARDGEEDADGKPDR